jgi:hypothetical protein
VSGTCANRENALWSAGRGTPSGKSHGATGNNEQELMRETARERIRPGSTPREQERSWRRTHVRARQTSKKTKSDQKPSCRSKNEQWIFCGRRRNYEIEKNEKKTRASELAAAREAN